mmetsp:Transcript_9695/g.16625  ORF Transcript_9695/g.16625 Transcript_9695/m.16625 type:complete len:196 (-) Transcript_9695:338-925(-)|eukprot:CAMPEP_0198213286 /NCGR_PEP_ID=MMETSP1445-20131203/28781_1 /TAXON_ID=36898 /ORGANISM="Pyramimonas sp., Strain CCMP2087" /LENGTH=195 /DNA_ID=CAMNT_0043887909 /DNA_START=67 /DNA_END=654 /DNA_ORIENTATION=+
MGASALHITSLLFPRQQPPTTSGLLTNVGRHARIAQQPRHVVSAVSKAYGASHKNVRRRLVAYSKGEEDVSESKMQQVMDFLEGLEGDFEAAFTKASGALAIGDIAEAEGAVLRVLKEANFYKTRAQNAAKHYQEFKARAASETNPKRIQFASRAVQAAQIDALEQEASWQQARKEGEGLVAQLAALKALKASDS